MRKGVTGLWLWLRVAASSLGLTGGAFGAEEFTVATYNLENYVMSPGGARPAKSGAAKAKLREGLRALRADVVALQEVGGAGALRELQGALRTEGLDYPHSELVPGHDTNIQVAVLSRFPIVARHPHTNESFLLQGRRFFASRGFGEVTIRVNAGYAFTLITAHLKSRRPSAAADEAEWREQEALLLREKIDAVLAAAPEANLIVLGDFNDTKDSPTIKALVGRGKRSLVDTRPAERNGDPPREPGARGEARLITWTHYYAREDTYARLDYILVSRGMAREWDPAGTSVLTLANWGLASDHRPVVAAFVAADQ